MTWVAVAVLAGAVAATYLCCVRPMRRWRGPVATAAQRSGDG